VRRIEVNDDEYSFTAVVLKVGGTALLGAVRNSRRR